MRSHGKILGLVPYDFRVPSLLRVRERLWYAREERSLVPVIFGVGRTQKLSSAPHHPFRGLLVVALMLWRWRVGRRG